jgi:hypothetical protein
VRRRRHGRDGNAFVFAAVETGGAEGIVVEYDMRDRLYRAENGDLVRSRHTEMQRRSVFLLGGLSVRSEASTSSIGSHLFHHARRNDVRRMHHAIHRYG